MNAKVHGGIRRIVSGLLALALAFTVGMPAVFAAPAAETGKFTSVGPSTTGATYYVDAENGNDANDGTSPDKAWQTLTKVSNSSFEPGDHILLEAGSTWNGDSQYNGKDGDYHASGNALMIWDSGEEGKPIVIDFYVNDNGKASYTSDKRPVINGNGTWGIGGKKTMVSAPVMTYNADNIEIYNLEVTNSPDLDDPDAYKVPGDAQRCGILTYFDDQETQFEHIVIQNCYVHDVQTEHHNARKDTSFEGLKASGGIIVLGHYMNPDADWMVGGAGTADKGKAKVKLDDVKVEYNVVKRVGLEGIRTKCQSNYSASGNTFNKTFTNVSISHNYLEDIAGDGIVMTEVVGGITQNNVAKQPCNADYGQTNYAGIWSMFADDILFQYNECYGIVYGYNDGEAYDIDLSSVNNTYQYNYSHHNSGGMMLFMGDQQNSVVRYNISAWDGFGNKGTNADKLGTVAGYTYDSQSIFHYWNKSDTATMPTIYNNTFYVGDGYDTALYGEGNGSDNTGVISRFYNNLIVKEGEGELKFLTHYPTSGVKATECDMRADGQTPGVSHFMKNNVFPTRMLTSFYTEEEFAEGGNTFANVKVLKIQTQPGLLEQFQAQKDDAMDVEKDDVAEYTSTEKLYQRAQPFQLDTAAEDYDVVAGKASAVTDNISGAPALKTDFFGNELKAGKALDIGAHQASDIDAYTEISAMETVEVETLAGRYPALPAQVEVTLIDHVGDAASEPYTASADVVWDIIPAEQYAAEGSFTVNGQLSVANASGGLMTRAVSAKVTVKAASAAEPVRESIVASADAYLQNGSGSTAYGAEQGAISKSTESDDRKAPFGYTASNNYTLKVKNATSITYNRRTVLSFDVSDVMDVLSDLNEATIRLTVDRYDLFGDAGFDATWRRLDVYDVTSDWDETTVTWNNLDDNEKASANHGAPGQKETAEPTYETYKPVAYAELSNADIAANGHVVEIDVLDYLRTLPKDTTTVSFLIDSPYSSNPNSNVDNGGFDAFSKEGAAAMFEQGLAESETQYAPQLYLSNVYATAVEPAELTVKMGAAPELPATVQVEWSDGTTSDETVVWDAVDANRYDHEDEFEIRGVVSGVNIPAVAKIAVKADHIVGWDGLETVELPVGTTMEQVSDTLPGSITVRKQDYATGEVSAMELPVNYWGNNEVAFDPNKTERQELLAYYDIPAGVIVDDDVRLSVDVSLYGSTDAKLTVVGDVDLDNVRPDSQIELLFTASALPGYETVTWTLEGNSSPDTRLLTVEEAAELAAEAARAAESAAETVEQAPAADIATAETAAPAADEPAVESEIATAETARLAKGRPALQADGEKAGDPAYRWSFELKFDANGGENAPETMTAGNNDTYRDTASFKIPEQEPVREGYTFLGWSEKADATAPAYTADEANGTKNYCQVKAEHFTDKYEDGGFGAKTIYAVWEKNAEPAEPEMIQVSETRILYIAPDETSDGIRVTAVIAGDMDNPQQVTVGTMPVDPDPEPSPDPEPKPETTPSAPVDEHPEIGEAIANGTWGQPKATATPAPQGGAASGTAANGSIPKTADSFALTLWGILAVASAAGLGVVLTLRRKQN